MNLYFLKLRSYLPMLAWMEEFGKEYVFVKAPLVLRRVQYKTGILQIAANHGSIYLNFSMSHGK